MNEFTLRECHRNNWCVDCDNTSCLHAGQAIADCPLYRCNREPDHFEDCESCQLLKEMKEAQRGEADEKP
jgi:hypothetical protein